MAYNTDIHPIPKFETKEQFPPGFNLPVCPEEDTEICHTNGQWAADHIYRIIKSQNKTGKKQD